MKLTLDKLTLIQQELEKELNKILDEFPDMKEEVLEALIIVSCDGLSAIAGEEKVIEVLNYITTEIISSKHH